MAIYDFVRQMLAWSIVAAVLGFIGFPWAIIAYKIWHGNKEIDEEFSEELMRRSWYFGWALGGIVDFFVANQFELPAGMVHVVFYIAFLSLAAWWAMFFFALEDFLQGLIFALIYLYLPTLVLYLLWWFFPLNPLFTYVLGWLPEPTA
jgi:hypothetical protein